MPTNSLRFARGDTLSLPGEDGKRALWKVEKRIHGGYILRSHIGDPDRLWSHAEIFNAYVSGQLEHWPCNTLALDANLAQMVQSDLEAWPERRRFEAKCREKYVLRAAKLRNRGVRAKDAYARASRVVTRAYAKRWVTEAIRIAAIEIHEQVRRRGIPKYLSKPSSASGESYELGEFAVRSWFQIWDRAGRDIRVLVSKTHLQGRRETRKTCRLSEQVDGRDPRCVYGAMEWVAKSVYMRVPRVTKREAYKRLLEICEEKGIEKVSETTFRNYLFKNFTDFEEHRARYGSRAAYLKYGIFERRELPTRAMEEVEIDHCLLDVFVVDQNGTTARPWLTALICRATKMIVGIHISFEPPSYVSLSRAIIHAMCPKNLSGIPEVENDWPCHGVFDLLITDRGREFLSESIQRVGSELRFAIVNLPGRMPHLKGTIERFFGTLGVRVLSHMEGATKSRTDQFYDPQAKAQYTLKELTTKIVKWIVDDYHYKKHDTLGMAPIERWEQLVEEDKDGGVRPAGALSRLVMVMGERDTRQISNIGIHFKNHVYASKELEGLRKRRGGLKEEYKILADPHDRGHIWVFDTEGKRWLDVPATNQRSSRGLNKFAARIVSQRARKKAPKDAEITDEMMEEARRECDEEAAAANTKKALRYLCNGALATNVAGNDGIVPVLTSISRASDANMELSTSSREAGDGPASFEGTGGAAISRKAQKAGRERGARHGDTVLTTSEVPEVSEVTALRNLFARRVHEGTILR